MSGLAVGITATTGIMPFSAEQNLILFNKNKIKLCSDIATPVRSSKI